jgi:DNA-binding XRE family transcriptional regulator
MRKDKQERLEIKGWTIGTAQEFLGLSDEEAAYVELKLRLAEGLRERRLRQQLTQNDMARLLQSSQSRVAKMEAGDRSVSLDLLVRALLSLGVSSRELARIVAGGEGTRAR